MAAIWPKSFSVFHLSGAETTLTMNMVMDVTTENGGCILPYLFHCGKRDVQVAHGSLWQAFRDLTFFQESETTTRLLTGISDLQ